MGRYNLPDFTVISFHIVLVFAVFSCNHLTATSTIDLACALIDPLKLCGKGTCEPNSTATLGYDCKCDPGWKHLQVLNVTIPICAFHNCTTDFQCGNGAPLQPLPPPPIMNGTFPPPNINITKVCDSWCMGGSCNFVLGNFSCDCNEGYGNLLKNPVLPCIQKCYLGGQCNNGLSPPPSGSNDVPNCSRSTPHALIMIILASLFLVFTF